MAGPELELLSEYPTVRAIVQAMLGKAPRTPDADVEALLSEDLPADLQALLWGWAHHSHPFGPLAVWDLFDRWDFLWSVEPVAQADPWVNEALPGHRPIAKLGNTAGGVDFIAVVHEGQTHIVGPEHGEDYGHAEDFFFTVWEWADFEAEPALAAFVPDDFFEV